MQWTGMVPMFVRAVVVVRSAGCLSAPGTGTRTRQSGSCVLALISISVGYPSEYYIVPVVPK
jgi:hypothetical protein